MGEQGGGNVLLGLIPGFGEGFQQAREQKKKDAYLSAQTDLIKQEGKLKEKTLIMESMKADIFGKMTPEQQMASLFPKADDSLESKLKTITDFAAQQGGGQPAPVSLPDYVPGSGTGPTRPGATMTLPQELAQRQFGGFSINKIDSSGKVEFGPTPMTMISGVKGPGGTPQILRVPSRQSGTYEQFQPQPNEARLLALTRPDLVGKEGTPEYAKAIADLMQMGGIQQTIPLGLDPSGKNLITFKSRGVDAGTMSSQPVPGGGQVIPVTERSLSEGDIQSLTAVSNLVEVLPDVGQMLTLRMNSGSAMTDPITGRVYQKMLDHGISAGVPDEAIKSHAALEHLKTWAMNVLKGAGSEGQRDQLSKTFPDLWDSPDIMRNKIRKTLQISRNVMDKRLASLRSSGKIVPPEFYEDLKNVDAFLAEINKPPALGKKKGDLSGMSDSDLLKELNK